MTKFLYLLTQYAQLSIFLLGCWGLGQLLLKRCALDVNLRVPLATALGLGGMIFALQLLSVAGLLYASAVLALVALGAGCAAYQWYGCKPRTLETRHTNPIGEKRTATERYLLALIALLTIPLLLSPLAPPLAWDELMYHLPHAKEWALHHELTVNEWIRYPWFPYNFDLLFAAALTLDNDVLPHLLHASTGWITAWLIYSLGASYLQSRNIAALAVVIWLVVSRSQYGSAYIDMGVTLLTLATCTLLLLWRDSGNSPINRQRYLLFTAAFVIGVAAGAKYQTLTLLPFFALVVIWYDRRIVTWLGCAASLLLPCVYWYARNALLTGDPFNPMGGKIFGFTDWNAVDHHGQFQDLHRVAGLPHWILWVALIAPLIPSLRKQSFIRCTLFCTAYMLVVWCITARYPRYLMPAFPLLALLSAAVLAYTAANARRVLASWDRSIRFASKFTAILLLIGLSISSWHASKKFWADISPTTEQREQLLSKRVTGYGVWTYLRQHPQKKIYQFYLEDAIYYAPRPIWGEVFGPWRYQDFAGLAPQQLYKKLDSQGFTAVVVHNDRGPEISAHADFQCYFEPLHVDGAVHLYRLKISDISDCAATKLLH